MKKFMSAILAVIMMFSIAIPVFAAEETTKNVDNTFDNFEPAPGKKAPDNWYDPYCYEADGRINKYCLNQGGLVAAIYCPDAKKIFTVAPMARMTDSNANKGFSCYNPYDVFCAEFDSAQWYCPYCGKYRAALCDDTLPEFKTESAAYTHKEIANVVYGFFCNQCESFTADDVFANDFYNINPFEFRDSYLPECYHRTDVNNIKLYRFLSEEQRNSEYSFIFTETEKDFGDGKDGRVEDLTKNAMGGYEFWESPDNPHYKPEEDKPTKKTFKDKLIDFFNKIAAFFAKIGAWFKKLFK